MLRNLPRPLLWRPKGYVPSLAELNASHGVVAKTDIKVGFNKQGENSPPLSVVELAEGRIVGELRLVVTRNSIAVGKLQSLAGSKNPANHYLLRNPRFRLLRRRPGVALLMGTPESLNYYHWLLNCLPRWKLLAEANRVQEYDYVLVNARACRFQEETLDRLGVPQEKRLHCSTMMLYQFDRLIVPDMPPMFRVPAWASTWVRTLFPERDNRSSKLVYISRRAAARRRLSNELLLEERLQQLGFAVVQLEHLTVSEQARVFIAAEFIVAPHGAGLANIIFATPGACVIELFHPDHVSQLYAELAANSGLRYDRVLGDCTRTSKTSDFVISIEDVVQTLQKQRAF